MAATSAPSDGRASAARDLRLAIRRGDHTGLTSGCAPGHVQATLAVLPAAHAPDFLAFCARNARACPVLGVSEPGSPHIPALAQDLDLRTDLPGYIVHRASQPPEAVRTLADVWRADLVAVALGCWFSMEDALTAAGVRLRHVELGIQGPLFKTNLPTEPVGAFGGPLVVSMRPFARDAVDTVKAVTGRFPRVHGAPLHAGDAAALGIADYRQPDFGEPMDVLPGEVPLYWPCGLTATVALQRSGISFFITHAPGKMLVTDWRNADLAIP